MDFYQLNESASSRYSVEVNYRTTLDEVINNWAKLTLGYVSAALKQYDFSVKKVFTEDPIRIIISNGKNGGYFQDGEWVGVITYNSKENSFYLSKGFYRKDTKSAVLTSHVKCKGNSAAEIFSDIRNFMHGMKDEKPYLPKLNPVKDKTGPTQGSMRPGQGLRNFGKL